MRKIIAFVAQSNSQWEIPRCLLTIALSVFVINGVLKVEIKIQKQSDLANVFV